MHNVGWGCAETLPHYFTWAAFLFELPETFLGPTFEVIVPDAYVVLSMSCVEFFKMVS